jgi:ATP-binding cassette subfamily B protein
VLLLCYLTGLVATYVQAQQMGRVGRFVLFKLRNLLFTKLQSLPLEFFHQNKTGDLISRINNDTDKLNQFFAQALVQVAANGFVMIGAAVFMIALNVRLGLAALAPAAAAFVFTRATGGWLKRKNLASLQALGALSGGVQEGLSNFRVIAAFNRGDYFERLFGEVNEQNYRAAVAAGIANTTVIPLYGLALTLAQVIVLAYGFYLIASGALTVGLLIGFLLYVNSFYLPLRQLEAIWSSFNWRWRASTAFPRCSRSKATCRRRRRTRGPASPRSPSITSSSVTCPAGRSCATRRSRSSAARPTRSSARPAAARRRRRC